MTQLPTHFESGQLSATSAARVTVVEPMARFSLRAGQGDVTAISEALDLALPTKIGQRTKAGATEAMCLGPDEWVIIAPDSEAVRLESACTAIYDQAPHSLTAISDREITVRIDGPRAADLLTLGCPRDLDAILPNEGRRTVFDGVTVVLWRDAEQEFRLDVWRSFAPHALSLLVTGCTELALE
ncbi:sarcosine oxidase subunit gamma [Meridianimarinicoccus aquatilis]|uniref:Sarcosine oxidase subunit gamma n=1 Tax=Meridianimarinicoccus aquatilis TaxID=2552766 RepID=A0A4R6ASD2_9RHOB|nr:sarcosine oxidase subunit gamma family protein [Fluviibacterium aquatile]TDL86887.1 sarcosine oxidase subunit gamma [Fluviibacterium aquatile]